MMNANFLPGGWHCLAAMLCLIGASPVAIAQSAATLTIAESKVSLLRGTGTYSAGPGVRFDSGDMIATEARGQAQLEFPDGLILNVGADSKLYLVDVAGAGGKPMEFALAAGWLKAVLPAAGKGESRPLRALLPGLSIETADATLVLHAGAGLDELFVESGTVKATELARDGTPGNTQSAKNSDYVSRKDGSGLASTRPPQAFLGGLPRHFADKLPAQIAKTKDLKREPVREHDTTFTEAEAWLKANSIVRKGLVARYQPLVKDAQFKAGLIANIAELPEWERVIGAAKKK